MCPYSFSLGVSLNYLPRASNEKPLQNNLPSVSCIINNDSNIESSNRQQLLHWIYIIREKIK